MPGGARTWVVAALAVVAFVGGRAAAVPASANPIVAENLRTGTPGWRIPSANGAVSAYASDVSLTARDVLRLHVSAPAGTPYRVVVFRLGWYGGVGARKVSCIPSCTGSSSGSPQPVPTPDPATGLVSASWPVTDSTVVGASWPSGYYVADVVVTAGPLRGSGDTVPFVVRAAVGAAPSAALVVAAVNTWQAYNSWGGKSTYGYNSDGPAAVKVSFDRPYSTRDPLVFDWEYQFVRFAERNGLDVSYATDSDLDRTPLEARRHRLLVLNGHAEYWTHGMRDAVEAARDAGVNVVFMGANAAYWQVRYENDRRTLVVYRSAALDPSAGPETKSTTFRSLVPPAPECALLGVQYQGGLRRPDDPPRDYTVMPVAAVDPWFAGTGLAPGDTIPDLVGNEWDAIVPGCAPPTLDVLFHYAWHPGDPDVGRAGADAVRYTAPSGARVFSTGTLMFSWALDDWGHPGHADPRLQRFMRNALTSLLR